MAVPLSNAERSNIIKLVVAMFDVAPGAIYLNELVLAYQANGRNLQTLAKDLANTGAYKSLNPASQTAAEFADAFLTPLGLQANAVARDFVISKLNSGVSKGEIAYQAAVALNATTDPQFASAKAILNNGTAVAEYYSVTLNGQSTNLAQLHDVISTVTAAPSSVTAANAANATELHTFVLTSKGGETLLGTAGNDTFIANFADNTNTFQSGDIIKGGAGTDSLHAELGTSSAFAIRANTTGVENVFFTAQSRNALGSNGDNNVSTTGQKVTVDAEKMVGVNQWWSTESRADLKIEDVRILDSQVTKDITIGLRNTDAGSMNVNDSAFGAGDNRVDFEVYFSPDSLRPAASIATSALTLVVSNPLRVSDGFDPTKPLENVPYTKVAFLLDGVEVIVNLQLDAVRTYDQLFTALKTAFAARPDLAGISIAQVKDGYAYVSTDGQSRVADQFVLSNPGHVLGKTGFGWLAEGGLPSDNAFLASVINGDTTSTNPLITSTIILDNVGREDEAGTLTIGSMSTHGGVERFEITVENNGDNVYAGTQSGSWLGHMQSTNNTLREVSVVNAAEGIANPDYLYLGTNMDKAGNNLTIMQDWPGGLTHSAGGITAVTTSLLNPDGLTDVRLFDASAFKGDVFVGATITDQSIRKYQNLVDALSNDKLDDVKFEYKTGAGNDSINLVIDGSMTASNSNAVAGRHDFSFLVDGGAGNDNIQVKIVNGLAGGTQDWYTNQSINNNVTINGGDGNDTIRKPGAGDATINGGSGNDTIYSDNSGVSAGAAATYNNGHAAWVFNTAAIATGPSSGVRDSNIEDLASDAAASVSAVNATLTLKFLGISKTVYIADSKDKLANVTITDLSVNQAIKAAINQDNVLNKLLIAKDGPGHTLIVESLIDGAMAGAHNLSIAFGNTALTTGQTSAGATVFSTATPGIGALLDGYGGGTIGGSAVDAQFGTWNGGVTSGANSIATTDNEIDGGTGNDVIVLSTTTDGATAVGSSNETVFFSGLFGNDTVVNFTAGTGFGQDILNFKGLGGTGANFGTMANKSIDVASQTTLNDTAAEVAALYADSLTAATHVYVAYDANNIGNVYAVVDAAGTGAGSVTATLMGTINLADTSWGSMGATNFA